MIGPNQTLVIATTFPRDGQGSGWTVGEGVILEIFTVRGWWGVKIFFDHLFPFYKNLAIFFEIFIILSFLNFKFL